MKIAVNSIKDFIILNKMSSKYSQKNIATNRIILKKTQMIINSTQW